MLQDKTLMHGKRMSVVTFLSGTDRLALPNCMQNIREFLTFNQNVTSKSEPKLNPKGTLSFSIQDPLLPAPAYLMLPVFPVSSS
jgi:hypothetical protein